jgi:putative transposase
VSCYRLIDQEKAHHPVSRLARVLGVARAGYYAWACRPLSQRTVADQALLEQIRQIHARSRGTYGAPRVHAELRLGLDIRVGRKRVARLMRDARLQGVHRRRLRGLTRRDPQAAPAPDLVERNFTPPAPDRLWVADITQQRTGDGWLYSRLCWTASPAASSAGRWPTTCAPNSCWTPLTWRSLSGSQRPG